MAGGYRVRPAARYRPPRPLDGRLALSSASRDGAGKIAPAAQWRAAGRDEIEALTGAPGEIDSGDVWLLGIPGHLLRRWWELAEQDGAEDEGLPGFDQYARELAEYFAYKRWPLPAHSLIEVAAADSAAQMAGGLRLNTQWPFSAGPAQLVACINLDEWDCAMIISDVLPADSQAVPDSNPNHPLLEVTLGPGEGLMVPPRILCGIRYSGPQEMAIYLTIGKRGS